MITSPFAASRVGLAARCVLLLAFAVSLAVAQDPTPPEPPPVDPLVDAAAGLTGLWECTVRCDDGKLARRVLEISHDTAGNVVVFRPARHTEQADLKAHPFAALPLNNLEYIQVDGGFTVRNGSIQSGWRSIGYEGQTQLTLQVRSMSEMSGRLEISPDWSHATWQGIRAQHVRKLPVMMRRLLPEVIEFSPKRITLDDLRRDNYAATITIRGRNLPVVTTLDESYPFHGVRMTGPGVELLHTLNGANGAPLRNGLRVEISVDPHGGTGPCTIRIMGVDFPGAVMIVDPDRTFDFARDASTTVDSCGFYEPFHLRMRFKAAEAPASDTLAATLRRDSDARGTGTAIQLRRAAPAAGDSQVVYLSEERIQVHAADLPAPAQTPGHSQRFITVKQKSQLVATCGNQVATLHIYDEPTELKKRLDALGKRLDDLALTQWAVNDLLKDLRESQVAFNEIAGLEAWPVEQLKSISAGLEAYAAQFPEGVTIQRTINSWVAAVGTQGSGARKAADEQLDRKQKALDESRAQLASLMPTPGDSDAATVLGKAAKAFGAFVEAATPLPIELFPAPMSRVAAAVRSSPALSVAFGDADAPYAMPDENTRLAIETLLSNAEPEGDCPIAWIKTENAGKKSFTQVATRENFTGVHMRELRRMLETTKDRPALHRQVMAVVMAAKLGGLVRSADELAARIDRRGMPRYIQHAKGALAFIAQLASGYLQFDEALQVERSSIQRAHDRIQQHYVESLITRDRDGELGAEVRRLKQHCIADLQRIDRVVQDANARLDAWLATMGGDLAALSKRLREVGELLVQMKTARDKDVPNEETVLMVVKRIDQALMIYSICKLLKGAGKFVSRRLLKLGDDLVPPAELMEQLKKGLKDKRPELTDDDLWNAVRKDLLTKNELDDLIGRLNKGAKLEDAVKATCAGRQVPKSDVIRRMQDAGMSETEAGKLYKRLGESGITRAQLDELSELHKLAKTDYPAAMAKSLGHLEETVKRLEDTHGINLRILSVGSGTAVDDYWRSSGAAADMPGWKLFKNDWDGAFFLDPQKGAAQARAMLDKLGKSDAGRLQEIERSLGHHVSLGEVRQRLSDLEKLPDRSAAVTCSIDDMKKQQALIERAIAQRYLEDEFRKTFTEVAKYPPSGPDFNLFSDNPLRKLTFGADIDDALRGKTSMMRHVELGPDGVFFTPGGKKYIDLMRVGQTPIKRGTKAWEAVDDAERAALISRAQMNPADGAGMTDEMRAFFFQNLAEKYKVKPDVLAEARRTLKDGTGAGSETLETFNTAANKTAKYYLRAALGRMASDPALGERMPELFKAATGSPEARIVAIANGAGKGLFTPQQLQRLENALAIKQSGGATLVGNQAVLKNGKSAGNPLRMISDWSDDLNDWGRKGQDAADQWYRNRGAAIGKLPADEQKAAWQALQNERALHDQARDLTMGRLSPDQLQQYAGIPAAEAQRIGALSKNPNVAPLLGANADDVARRLREAGHDKDAVRINRAAYGADEVGGDEDDLGVMDLIDMPIEWVSHIRRLKGEGGVLAWARVVTNVAFNVFFSGWETLSRVMLMAYRYYCVDRDLVDKLSGELAIKLMGIEYRLGTRMLGSVESTQWDMFYDQRLTTVDLEELDLRIRQTEDRLTASTNATSGTTQARYRALLQDLQTWAPDTWAPERTRRQAAILSSDARLERGAGILRALRLPIPAKGAGTRPVVTHWHDLVVRLRTDIVDQSAVYRGDFLRSQKVVGTLGLLLDLSDTLQREIRAVSGRRR